MPVVVKVVPQDEYDAWVQEKKEAAFRMAELTEKEWSVSELTERGEGVGDITAGCCTTGAGK